MSMTDFLVLVTRHDIFRGDIVRLSEFCRDNASDPDLCEDVKCLARGFGFTVGGGAAPAVTISRWS